MSVRGTLTGAILAGGRSTRMGGSPKQNLVLASGGTMIEAVAAALGEVCREVVIVGTCDALPGLVRIADLRPGCGPLGGIEALLAGGSGRRYLVCPCDVPNIDAAPLRALAHAPEAARAAVLRFGDAESFEPLPARIDADALPIVRRLLDNGHRSVFALMRELSAAHVPAPAAWRPLLRNVNSPGDVPR